MMTKGKHLIFITKGDKIMNSYFLEQIKIVTLPRVPSRVSGTLSKVKSP